MSLGVLMLATAGGALGGYMLRVRQEKSKLQLPQADQENMRIINAKPEKPKQLPAGRSLKNGK